MKVYGNSSGLQGWQWDTLSPVPSLLIVSVLSHPILPKCSLGQRLPENRQDTRHVFWAIYIVDVQIPSYNMQYTCIFISWDISAVNLPSCLRLTLSCCLLSSLLFEAELRVALNPLCSQGWPWTSDLPAFHCHNAMITGAPLSLECMWYWELNWTRAPCMLTKHSTN